MGKPGTAWKKSGELNAKFKKDVRAHQQHCQASGTANMDLETQNTANLCDRLLNEATVSNEVKKRCRVAYMETLRWIKDGPSPRFGKPLSRHTCTKCKNGDSNGTHHALCQNVLRKFKNSGEKDLRDALIQCLTNCQTRHPLWKVDGPTDHGQKSLDEISWGRATCSIFHTQKPGDEGGSRAAAAHQRVDVVSGNVSSVSPLLPMHGFFGDSTATVTLPTPVRYNTGDEFKCLFFINKYKNTVYSGRCAACVLLKRDNLQIICMVSLYTILMCITQPSQPPQPPRNKQH